MENKRLFGICKVGEKGQIVIPKEAREMFEIKPGDNLVLLGDKNKGMALVKADIFDSITDKLMSDDNDNY